MRDSGTHRNSKVQNTNFIHEPLFSKNKHNCIPSIEEGGLSFYPQPSKDIVLRVVASTAQIYAVRRRKGAIVNFSDTQWET